MKHNFSYHQGKLHWGSQEISVEQFTKNYTHPKYIYDGEMIRARASLLKKSLGQTKVFYAVKANANVEVLQVLRQAGCGADVVSAGEILQAEKAGFHPSEIIFSGVGKTRAEIQLALEKDIHQINVESFEELERISEIAKKMKKRARIALRVNPDVSIQTHPYIATGLKENKFGIAVSTLESVVKFCLSHKDELECVGLSMHLGSQMLEFAGFRDALRIQKKIFLEMQTEMKSMTRFDFGGGLGIFYDQDRPDLEEVLLQEYAAIVAEELADLFAAGIEVQTEPGRWLVGHGGILLSQVQYVKKTPYKTFVVLDTGMHHLLRPSLYQAHHEIYPLVQRAETRDYDFVGPICESSDVIAKDRKSRELMQDDFVVIADTGAYGYSMASGYNMHAFPEEILVVSDAEGASK